MSQREWKSREIVERIVVEGDLALLTPTSLGNGDSDGLTDMSLLLDEVDGTAVLTGTSIAGALRNHLRERLLNFGVSEESQYKDSQGQRLKDKSGKHISLPIVTQLFGSLEDDGAQSLLIIDDARSIDEAGKPKLPTTELRDGVRIEGKTRTAYIDETGHGAKFDVELVEAGTTFRLRFELLVTQEQMANLDGLVSAFTTALQGFEKREIQLGARKRRGYGECEISKWRVKRFDLIAKDETDLVDWLRDGAKPLADLGVTEQDSISSALGAPSISDQREYFELSAGFALDGSMLIRSGSELLNVSEKGQPDTVHLRSKHKDKGYVPIVAATSLAGVLRHRAVKICNTLKGNSGERFVEKLFGVDMEKLKERNTAKGTNEQPFASRLEVKETFIENTNDLIHTRVKIDRFTGGAFEGALFDAAPVFAKNNEQALTITLRLRNPSDAELGLLLLLLKDLWTSDLAVGGESSIGRGRLKGISASLHNRTNDSGSWRINLMETDKIEAQLVAGSLPDNETETKFLNGLAGKLRVELEKDNANN